MESSWNIIGWLSVARGMDGIFHERQLLLLVYILLFFFFFIQRETSILSASLFHGGKRQRVGGHVREQGRYDFLRLRRGWKGGGTTTDGTQQVEPVHPFSPFPTLLLSPLQSIVSSFPSFRRSFRFGNITRNNTPCLFSGICYVYYAISRFSNKLFNQSDRIHTYTHTCTCTLLAVGKSFNVSLFPFFSHRGNERIIFLFLSFSSSFFFLPTYGITR